MNYRPLLHLAGGALALALFWNPTVLPAAENAGSAVQYIRPIQTGRPLEVYDQSETVSLPVLIKNTSARVLANARFTWTVIPWALYRRDAAPPPEGGRDVSLGAGETLSLNIEYTPAALGWHEVLVELKDASGAALGRQRLRFSVGATARADGKGFHYGVCAHLLWSVGTPALDRQVALIDRLGVDLVRDDVFTWDMVEPREGAWDFSKTDQVFAALAPSGVGVQALLAFSARWASTGDPAAADWHQWNNKAPRMGPWLDYVDTVLKRYGDRVRYWEVWNEPDIDFWLSPTTYYIKLFDATSAFIKNRDPRATVLNGGLAAVRREPNPNFVDEFLAGAAEADWGVFAYHDYNTFADFLARRSMVGGWLRRLKQPRPVWINEGGFHTLLGGGEKAQALMLVKKIASSPAFGIGAYFWYDMLDDGENPNETEHHFGLAYRDGQPKPAWSAYQALIRELGRARYLRSVPASELRAGGWAHLYELPGKAPATDQATHVLVLWQEGGSRLVPSWLGVGDHARVLGASDLMGNPVAASASGHGAVLTLGDEPIYVHIRSEDGGAPALTLRSLLDAPPLAVLFPGRETQLMLRFANPFPESDTLKLDFAGNIPGMEVLPTRVELLLAAGEARDVLIRLQPPAKPADGPAPRLALNIAFANAGVSLPAGLPISLAIPVPRMPVSESGMGTSAAIRLVGRDHVYNRYSAEPNPLMHWQGVDDLGGSARFVCDADGLRVEVSVRDNAHVQKDIGADLWQSDSLQLGIRPNETDAGFIELGLARAEDGQVGGWVYSTVSAASLPLGRLAASVRREVSRVGTTTTYRLHLPWSALGRTGPITGGFRMNFIVNDDDGRGRKQWLKLSDGLGDAKTPELWPIFSCQ